MDTLSRLNSLLQSLRHAPAHFTITSETIFSVRLSLDPATMKLITSDPYLSARVNAALKKGAKDRNRGAAKRKAALDVVGALESLVKNGNVKVKAPLTKPRKTIAIRRKTPKAKPKSTLDDVSSEGNSADDEEEDQVQSDGEDEDMEEETEDKEDMKKEKEDDEYTTGSDKEQAESSCAWDDAATHSSMRRAASAATITSQKMFNMAMPVPSKKRKRGMTEAECTEERRRKDARRA